MRFESPLWFLALIFLFFYWYFQIRKKAIPTIKFPNVKLLKELQNKKNKFVDLKYDNQSNQFKVNGSSYTGLANNDNVIGNWWSHKILQASSQISPISGSIKEQVVKFLGKETITLYGKSYEVEHFKLQSKDMSIPKDKRLDFDIWYDKENSIIRKVTYSRMGEWEYRVKEFN